MQMQAVLLPLSVDFKEQVANAVRASVADEQKRRLASKLRPSAAMNLLHTVPAAPQIGCSKRGCGARWVGPLRNRICRSSSTT